jgi:Arc/MetJ-type ribon-helix-helix transcriptional regulator
VTPRRLYNFRIDAELDEGLKLVKERDGISESEQIRRAVREWLENKGVMKAERKRAATRKRS